MSCLNPSASNNECYECWKSHPELPKKFYTRANCCHKNGRVPEQTTIPQDDIIEIHRKYKRRTLVLRVTTKYNNGKIYHYNGMEYKSPASAARAATYGKNVTNSFWDKGEVRQIS